MMVSYLILVWMGLAVVNALALFLVKEHIPSSYAAWAYLCCALALLQDFLEALRVVYP